MRRLLLLVLVLVVGIVVGYRWHGARLAQVPAQFVAPTRIVDLSLTITEDLPLRQLGAECLRQWKLPLRTTFRSLQEERGPLYLSQTVYELFNHAGTHLDPASHVIPGGLSADAYPLTKLIGPARVLDFRSKARDAAITVADLKNKGIQAGEIVIVYTGYQPPTHDSELPSYPYLSAEAAQWLAQLPIKAFASDLPSLGSMRRYPQLLATAKTASDVIPEHLIFLTREIPNIAGLANLEAILNEPNVVFVGFPLKIKDCDGGLLRAAALVY